jgi:hypothetical protein
MADTKITSLLTPQVTTNPATDVLPIVNIADTLMASSGSTRKITVNTLLGSGGTATLASATITGDLTVKTNVLKVDSANNRVGILTASPTHSLDVRGIIKSNGTFTAYINPSFSGAAAIQTESAESLILAPSGQESLRCAPSGVYTFSDGAGGTRMTLNSTGLAVGTASATTKLDVQGSGDGELRLRAGSDAALIFSETTANKNWKIKPSSGTLCFQYSATAFNSGYANLLQVTETGNLGIGVTPSAWSATFRSLDIGSGTLTSQASQQTIGIYANAFENGTNYTRKALGTAAGYNIYNGAHYWLNAVSGAAASTFSFGDAKMTLDASGNLLVGTTSGGGTFDTKLFLSSNSGTNKWAVGPYGTATNFAIIPTPGTGGVYLSGTAATSWTAYSDERLKDIIEPITNAVAKIGSLRAVIGKFKNDNSNTRKSFLIAQDVQLVLPEAVDTSNPDRLGVAYSDVIPLLVAAIKELTARVQTLEAK